MGGIHARCKDVSLGTMIQFSPGVRRETRQSPPSTRYLARVGEHQLEAMLEPSPCRDDMSGETFEVKVSVRMNNRTYHGCGRPLH